MHVVTARHPNEKGASWWHTTWQSCALNLTACNEAIRLRGPPRLCKVFGVLWRLNRVREMISIFIKSFLHSSWGPHIAEEIVYSKRFTEYGISKNPNIPQHGDRALYTYRGGTIQDHNLVLRRNKNMASMTAFWPGCDLDFYTLWTFVQSLHLEEEKTQKQNSTPREVTENALPCFSALLLLLLLLLYKPFIS